MTACELVFLCCFRETYKVTILQRKAARLSQETGGDSLKTAYDPDETNPKQKTPTAALLDSITRPFLVFASSAVLLALSLFAGMTFTYFYIMSTTLPDILADIYGLTPAQTGLSFISFSVGSLLMVALCNVYLDRIYIHLRATHHGVNAPEYRLPLVILGSLALPVAVAAYGWIAQSRLPLPAMLACVALLGFTMMLGYLPVTAYVVDALGVYSASGMTAMIVSRCLMGTFFPLAAGPLVRRFGYGWGFTVLAGISVALAPIPMVLYRYGGRWRERSPYTRQP